MMIGRLRDVRQQRGGNASNSTLVQERLSGVCGLVLVIHKVLYTIRAARVLKTAAHWPAMHEMMQSNVDRWEGNNSNADTWQRYCKPKSTKSPRKPW